MGARADTSRLRSGFDRGRAGQAVHRLDRRSDGLRHGGIPRRFPLAPTGEHMRRGVAAGYVASLDRKSTRLNSSHVEISYAVFCLKKKTTNSPASARSPATPSCAITSL